MCVSRGETLSIVNITDPVRLPILAQVSGLDTARGVYKHGRYLYIAGVGQFFVVDLFIED